MIALGLVPFACSLLLALTARGLARRLNPAVAAPLLTLTALATSLATGIALSLAGFTVLARIPLVATLGGWPDDRLHAWTQLPTGWAIAAAALAGGLLASALVYLARVGWDLARAHRPAACCPAGDQLVITPRITRPRSRCPCRCAAARSWSQRACCGCCPPLSAGRCWRTSPPTCAATTPATSCWPRWPRRPTRC